MRSIQEVFNTIIQEGFYGPSGFPFMCLAAKVACSRGFITITEEEAIGKEITAFLLFLNDNNTYGSVVLIKALRNHIPKWSSYEHKGKYMRKIYQNWDNRFEILKEIQDKIGFTKD